MRTYTELIFATVYVEELKNIKVMNGNTKKLTLSLKKQWFDLTKSGVKTEDYREINDYWTKRLTITKIDWNTPKEICEQIVRDFENNTYTPLFKTFDFNIMTLGYPKATDSERILKLEHKGIEIREGNPEWGAIPGRKYFVILHGSLLK